MDRSAHMPNKYWGHQYRHVSVVEVEGASCEPTMLSERARGVKRIVATWERCHVGRANSGRCAFSRAMRVASGLADHLNFLESNPSREAKRDRIASEANSELQRELIERYGGIEQYMRDVGAAPIHGDDTGTLWRIDSAAEPIAAVEVACPSTGRVYMLRVPPEMATAHEAVAWTFGLDADDYQLTAQS
jgi:hypothetical protein